MSSSKKNNTIVSTEIKSSLPDFLLNFVDAFIKLDKCAVFRYQFLKYPIDYLIHNHELSDASTIPIWIFLNPYGNKDLLITQQQTQFFTPAKISSIKKSNSHTQQKSILKNNNISSSQNEGKALESLFRQQKAYKQLSYNPNTNLQQLLKSQSYNLELTSLKNQKFTNIDIIRLSCQANTYFDPQQIIIQIKKIIAWNQFYRASSKKSYQYLSKMYQGLLDLIQKKNFFKKFYDTKAGDLDRLSKAQANLKINISQKDYPIIPSNFREYEQLDDYEPSPSNRKQAINKRLQSLKEPVKCPQNCVCILNLALEENKDKSFCSYSLCDGWVTQCPNRLRKVECNHQNKQEMDKCRNGQIKKGQRKKCKAYQSDICEGFDIQQCIAWGIDLSTRINIYFSLPQIDINFLTKIQNSAERNRFIEKVLLRAVNFNDKQGYSMKKACQFIIQNSPSLELLKSQESNQEKQNDFSWSGERIFIKFSQNFKSQKNNEYMFTYKDRNYAENLLKNFEISKDKTAFRIHTKGKGVKCRNKNGIQKGRFIVQYYGQLYQPWRWYQKQDFIKQTLKKKKLKNLIPQFYNIYLEKHKDEPNGYDLMVVDPIRKGNFSSRFSHSCDPNCGTVITVSQGRYHIGMYSFRDITYGEELSFDYCSMTESNFEHQNSICLCGMKRCRGNYLQLINSKANNLLDKNNSFHYRNATILRSTESLTEQDIQRCEKHAIKPPFLKQLPQWMAKWVALILKYIQQQCQSYKQHLIQKWHQNYQWDLNATPQQKQKNIQLYSESYKNDLSSSRFQNLFTTIDKLKYYVDSIQDKNPPLQYSNIDKVAQALIYGKQSVFEEIIDSLIQFYSSSQNYIQIQEINSQNQKQKKKIKQQGIAFIAKQFKIKMNEEENPKIKLFYFRYSCLIISHLVLRESPPQNAKKRFSNTLFSDIVYFYAFTHTFFTPHQYQIYTSQPIQIWINQIIGGKRDGKVESTKKKYSSQFIWGQLVSWFKQTIVSPQASLSQDRRGTLSFPTIQSTKFSRYPFEGHNRKSFFKALKQKNSCSWPPSQDCSLSYKNNYKCYGTITFQNHYNQEIFKQLPRGSLLQSAIDYVNLTLRQKIYLFKKVEVLINKTPQDSPLYDKLLQKNSLDTKIIESLLDQSLPKQILEPVQQQKKKGCKKKKLNQEDQKLN